MEVLTALTGFWLAACCGVCGRDKFHIFLTEYVAVNFLT